MSAAHSAVQTNQSRSSLVAGHRRFPFATTFATGPSLPFLISSGPGRADERGMRRIRFATVSLLGGLALALSFGCASKQEDGAVGEGGKKEPFVPLPEVLGVAPAGDINPDDHILEVNLAARARSVPLADGEATPMLNYNDQLPGPLLHARVGDRIIVHFTNELDEETTIHWHGLRISDQMDGSPMIQSPIPPGGSFTYDFVVPDAGTYWYHTHLHQIQQFEKGLYGAIVVHEKDAPSFTAERLFVADDIRLTATNQIAPFQSSGPDIGMGRVGNTLVMNGRAEPLKLTIPRGAVERWRFIMATNSLAYGLKLTGADVKVIATDGGLLPTPVVADRVEVAPGNRYDFEIRPKADATEVKMEAMILQLDANDMVVEVPFEIAKATIEGDVTPVEPVYPVVTLPPIDVEAEQFDWKLSGGVVDGNVEFTINGESTFVGDDGHAMLGMFEANKPVKIRLFSDVSPAHPFHLHGQFFQIIARGGKPVTDEPGLRDTVHVRGAQSVTVLTYFENPGQWMAHCHISEHSEKGMMGEIMVHAPAP